MRKLPERLAESYRACRVSTGNGTHLTLKLATELRNGLKPSAVRLVAALHHIHQQTEGLSFDKMLRHEKRLRASHRALTTSPHLLTPAASRVAHEMEFRYAVVLAGKI